MADCRRYEGDFKHDEYNGKGTYYCAHGDRYEGDYKDDKINGKGHFQKVPFLKKMEISLNRNGIMVNKCCLFLFKNLSFLFLFDFFIGIRKLIFILSKEIKFKHKIKEQSPAS